jgi:hypothetical protein
LALDLVLDLEPDLELLGVIVTIVTPDILSPDSDDVILDDDAITAMASFSAKSLDESLDIWFSTGIVIVSGPMMRLVADTNFPSPGPGARSPGVGVTGLALDPATSGVMNKLVLDPISDIEYSISCCTSPTSRSPLSS